MTVMTWSQRPIRTSTAVGSPNIDFTGLYDFGALLLTIEGLRYTGTDPDTEVLVQLSHDGVTFDAAVASYKGLVLVPPANGVGGFMVNSLLDKDIDTAHRIVFTHWNEAKPTWADFRGGRLGAGTGARAALGYHNVARKCQAMRITNSLGYNWSGNIGVYLRQRQSL